jgi:hypothetical protein
MSLLDPGHTIQMSPSMSAAVAAMRSWIGRTTSTCIVVASAGSGKSHLLAAARREVEDAVVMPAADGSDCKEFMALLGSGPGRAVIADDLDKFSKGLREEVISRVADFGHSILASMTELSTRTRGLILAKRPDAAWVFLDDPVLRPQDVEAFAERWIALNGLAGDRVAALECANFCCASRLPHGFRTVDQFLGGLAGSGWGFSGALPAADAASAYRQATSPPPTRPILLVEGYTDRLYFEWLLEGLPSSPAVEVRDCGGAKIVAEQAIALRNQGRPCVAVLDSDIIGIRLRKQLVEFGHTVVSVPIDAVNLPKSAYDHVQQVAEIEDLLPVSLIEEFLSNRQRKAELEIRAPTGVRYVIGEKDKRDLARWVVEETDRVAAPKLSAFLGEALNRLGVDA